MSHLKPLSSHARSSGASRHHNIKHNENGGVLVTKDDIRILFDMIGDNKNDEKSKPDVLSLHQVQEKLSIFFPQMTTKEFKVLLGGNKEISIEDLERLLLNNDLANYDPSIDAFHALDPLETGHVDSHRVKEVFKKLGYGDLSPEEMNILMHCADFDKDGVIGLDDFRALSELPLINPFPTTVSTTVEAVTDNGENGKNVDNMKRVLIADGTTSTALPNASEQSPETDNLTTNS